MIPRVLGRYFSSSATSEFFTQVTAGAKGLPRAGLYQSVVGNQMAKYYVRTACPGFFDGLEAELPKGATAALETLVASTQSDEYMTVLGHCSEKRFFEQWKLACSPAAQWKLDHVRSARIDTLYAVIGALRGDSMKGKQFVELFGQHFVVSPEFAASIKIPDFRQRATKCLPYLFADGAVVRARALVTVDQQLKLGEGDWVKQENVEHLLTLELALTPRIGKQSMLASESILELTEDPMKPGNWQIADANFALSDNYPLEPPEGDSDDKK